MAQIFILTEGNIKIPLLVRVQILWYPSYVSVTLKKFILLVLRIKKVLHEGMEENQWRTSIRIVSVPVETETDHPPNTTIECYRYANPLGEEKCVVNHDRCRESNLFNNGLYYWNSQKSFGARGSVVGWGTMLQAGRSRVRVSM
jgi:hypothetical protein